MLRRLTDRLIFAHSIAAGSRASRAASSSSAEGFSRPAFQQAPGDFEELPLGLMLVDVENDQITPHDQPVDDRFQDRGLADARPGRSAAGAGLCAPRG